MKKLRLLCVLLSLVAVFSARSAFSASYNCAKTYTSCNGGYTLSGGQCLIQGTITITLNKMGGNGTVNGIGGTTNATIQCTSGASCTVPAVNGLSRSNGSTSYYSSNGAYLGNAGRWCTAPNGGGTCITGNTSYTFSGPMELYADFACSTGYYKTADNVTQCVEVGNGYFSPGSDQSNNTRRYQCPSGYGNTHASYTSSQSTTTAETIRSCYKDYVTNIDSDCSSSWSKNYVDSVTSPTWSLSGTTYTLTSGTVVGKNRYLGNPNPGYYVNPNTSTSDVCTPVGYGYVSLLSDTYHGGAWYRYACPEGYTTPYENHGKSFNDCIKLDYTNLDPANCSSMIRILAPDGNPTESGYDFDGGWEWWYNDFCVTCGEDNTIIPWAYPTFNTRVISSQCIPLACPEGTYGTPGNCTTCENKYYCTGGQRYSCESLVPAATLPYITNITSVVNGNWGVTTGGSKPADCMCDWTFSDAQRWQYLQENVCQSGPVSTTYTKWDWCNVGYYPIDSLGWGEWYSNCTACTNKPENSYYTWRGSDWAYGGGAQNDCAWECNSGYHKEGGVCVSNIRDCSEGGIAAGYQDWNGGGWGSCRPQTTDYGCHWGYYNNNGQTCEICPSGEWCYNTRNSCPEGYDDGGSSLYTQSQCAISCPAGTQVVSANTQCTTPAGSWYIGAHNVTYGNVSTPELCSANFATPNTTVATDHDAAADCAPIPITCAAGTYLPANSSTCTTCPAGSYCGGGTYTFNATTAQGITACPALANNVLITGDEGVSSANGSTNINQCYMHHAAVWENHGAWHHTDGGYTGGSACYWDGSAYKNCPKTYDVCEQGYYLTTNGAASGFTNSCQLCAAGYIDPTEPWDYPLQDGTRTPLYNGATYCAACEGGTYQDEAGQASCKSCPVNDYDVGNMLGYHYWTDNGVQDTVNGCRAAWSKTEPSGSYSYSCAYNGGSYGGVTYPSDCMIGSASCANGYVPATALPFWKDNRADVPGNVCIAAVVTCAAGEFLPANTTACTTCAAGSWCGGGTYTFNATTDQGITACPEGYRDHYASGTGLSAQDQCLARCLPGTRVVNPGGLCTTPAGTWYAQDIDWVRYGNVSQTPETCHYGMGPGYSTPNTTLPEDHDNQNDCKLIDYVCTPGKYLPAGALVCETCPAGSWCGGGTYKYNQMANQGITACPVGYTIGGTGLSAQNQCTISCLTGTRVVAATQQCTTPSGSWYMDAHLVTYGSTSTVDACQFGYATPNTTNGTDHDSADDCALVPVTCTYGWYLPANSLTCTVCKDGHYCAGGTYTLDTENDQGVELCPENYRDNTGWVAEVTQCAINCPDGTIIVNPHEACTTPDGSWWAPGGLYGYGQSSNYNLCPDNHSTPNTTNPADHDSSDDCTPLSTTCVAGEFLPADTLDCAQCPAGYYCAGGEFVFDSIDQGISSCPDGYDAGPLSASTVEECQIFVNPGYMVNVTEGYAPIPCWGGSGCIGDEWVNYGSNSQNVVTCQGYEYGPIGATECLACPGVYIDDTATGANIEIEDCEAVTEPGYYIANAYDENETECPQGYYCPALGEFINYGSAGGDYRCPGAYTEGGPGASDMMSCQAITNPGYYVRLLDMTHIDFLSGAPSAADDEYYAQQECPAGSYCSGGVTVMLFEGMEGDPEFGSGKPYGISECPENYRDGGSGASEESQCLINCSAGTQVENPGDICTTPGSSWYIGDHSVGYGSTSAPESCPADFGTPDTMEPTDHDSSEDCAALSVMCDQGNYLPVGTLECAQCPAGSYCGGGEFMLDASNDQGVNACPEGYINGPAGATYEYECEITCSAGTRVENNYEACTIPAGKWYVGEHNVVYGQISEFNDCRYGVGTPPELSSPTDHDSIEDCSTTCIAGEYLQTNYYDCQECPNGHYCPGGTYYPDTWLSHGINSCPEGYIDGSAGLSAENQCAIACLAGTQVVSANAQCTTPDGNWYLGDHIVTYGNTSTPNSCPVGFATPNTTEAADHTAADDCAALSYTCAAGQYLPANATACVTCAAGSWCSGGTYAFNETDNQGLTACPTGYVNGGTGLAAENQCKINCLAGTQVVSVNTQCTTPAGSWYLGAHSVTYGLTSTPNSCVFGYSTPNTTTATDHDAVADCAAMSVTCGTGQYLPANTLACDSCMSGSYCLGGTYSFNATVNQGLTACPTGYIFGGTGLSAQNQCAISVPAGKYILASQDIFLTTCPAGYYCVGGMINYGLTGIITQCPARENSSPNNATGLVSANQCMYECSEGYTRFGDLCLQACTKGMTVVKVGNVSIPLYDVKATVPALAIDTGEGVCYGNMAEDSAANAVNVSYDGKTYHSVLDITPEFKGDFEITLVGASSFSFDISASGNFAVSWGDGSVETIEKLDTTNKRYSHPYSTAGNYSVKLAGLATGYNSDTRTAAISFYNSANKDKITKISGGVGRIFPNIGTSMPRFYRAFADIEGLQEIPDTLFTGINGAPVSNMFDGTFMMNFGLKSIPGNLFNGINGEPAPAMFMTTFSNCSALESIPEDLFNGISGQPASDMFYMTFSGCSGLKGSIPGNLFSGVRGAPASKMFYGTFGNCSGLTGSIPGNLFSGIVGVPAANMFEGTFNGCRGLTGDIPATLFSGITGLPANSMFFQTFKGCIGLESVPATLFSGISGRPASSMFNSTFDGCKSLASLPSGLFSRINGATVSGMFSNTFAGCDGLRGSIPTGLFGTFTGSLVTNMFNSTFKGCSGLTGISDGIWNLTGVLNSGTTNGNFQDIFNGCVGIQTASPNIAPGSPTKLWQKFTPGVGTVGGFAGCTEMTDFDNIPAGWK